ncbi:MAG TPA: hypothetical protein VNB24_00120 [Acidimicrobiales bacterium]|nr:hypothetical protein [Acidimicrobiales bacterium]
MKAVTALIARTQLTRGRVLTLLAVSGLSLLFAVGIAAGDAGGSKFLDTISMIDGFALTVAAPVVALVLASAAFGDLVDDGTLVYLWLRPVPRWQLAAGAAAASVGTALPIVVIPVTAAAAIGSGFDSTAIVATAAATTVAVIGYAGLFLALGLKIRRALIWGLAYILIWEGFVSRGVAGAAKLSIQVHARTILARLAETELPRNPSAELTAFAVPIVVGVVAAALTARWLRTTEVA